MTSENLEYFLWLIYNDLIEKVTILMIFQVRHWIECYCHVNSKTKIKETLAVLEMIFVYITWYPFHQFSKEVINSFCFMFSYSDVLCCQILLLVTQISRYDNLVLPYIRQKVPLKSWITSCPLYEPNYAIMFTLLK